MDTVSRAGQLRETGVDLCLPGYPSQVSVAMINTNSSTRGENSPPLRAGTQTGTWREGLQQKP